jgi:hypothetical protein
VILQEKDPDTEDTFGKTPLSYAVERGNVRLVLGNGEVFYDKGV